LSLLLPDGYLTSVLALDPAQLRDAGVRGVLLDMDNTVLPRGTSTVPADIVAWIGRLQSAGIAPLLLSNNWHESARLTGEAIGVPVVAKACKPLPFAFLRACRRLGLRRREVIMVGDQLATDIWGAKLVGMHAVLVCPLTDIDIRASWLSRRLERAVMGDRRPSR